MAINPLAALRYQGGLKCEVQVNPPTIPVTGNADAYAIVPEDGFLESVDFSGADAVPADNAKYVTFSITNLGQNGLGTTAMLAVTDANTTKAGNAAHTRRKLVLSGVPGVLKVKTGDRLKISAVATGTLATAVTFPVILLRFVA